MDKIKIRLPATLTHFGATYATLGLAVSRYIQVEISPRTDDQIVLETAGEGRGHYPTSLRHPTVIAMSRVFQTVEQAPTGVTIHVNSNIPMDSGLNANAAFSAAGIIGANNLLKHPLSQDQLIQLTAEQSDVPVAAITAIRGGLMSLYHHQGKTIVTQHAISPFKLIIAIPRIDSYTAPTLPERLPRSAFIDSLQRTPALLNALAHGDMHALIPTLSDALYQPLVREKIGGYNHVSELARLAGAIGVTTSGGGPAVIFFADRLHDRIAEAIETAFDNLQIPADVSILNVDTQGVVVSMVSTG